MKRWLVNGKHFDSTSELKRYIQRMLARYIHGQYLERGDAEFMLCLLRYHPQSEDKLNGVTAGVLVHNRDKGRGFTLHKETGELVPFSWEKCLAPPNHWEKFTRTCRSLVRSDIQQIKKECFNGKPFLKCPITGELLTPDTCHMDHQPPLTFSNLVRGFVNLKGIQVESVRYVNGGNYLTFESAELSRDWIEFHRQNATLRPVSARANLSIIPKLLKGGYCA